VWQSFPKSVEWYRLLSMFGSLLVHHGSTHSCADKQCILRFSFILVHCTSRMDSAFIRPLVTIWCKYCARENPTRTYVQCTNLHIDWYFCGCYKIISLLYFIYYEALYFWNVYMNILLNLSISKGLMLFYLRSYQ